MIATFTSGLYTRSGEESLSEASHTLYRANDLIDARRFGQDLVCPGSHGLLVTCGFEAYGQRQYRDWRVRGAELADELHTLPIWQGELYQGGIYPL